MYECCELRRILTNLSTFVNTVVYFLLLCPSKSSINVRVGTFLTSIPANRNPVAKKCISNIWNKGKHITVHLHRSEHASHLIVEVLPPPFFNKFINFTNVNFEIQSLWVLIGPFQDVLIDFEVCFGSLSRLGVNLFFVLS